MTLCDHFSLVLSSIVSPRVSHSFPTRRSSDLGSCRTESNGTGPRSTIPPPGAVITWKRRKAMSHGPESTAALRRKRSEEHTSELQSHSDLVCRLLLEKKKQIHRLPPGDPENSG